MVVILTVAIFCASLLMTEEAAAARIPRSPTELAEKQAQDRWKATGKEKARAWIREIAQEVFGFVTNLDFSTMQLADVESIKNDLKSRVRAALPNLRAEKRKSLEIFEQAQTKTGDMQTIIDRDHEHYASYRDGNVDKLFSVMSNDDTSVPAETIQNVRNIVNAILTAENLQGWTQQNALKILQQVKDKLDEKIRDEDAKLERLQATEREKKQDYYEREGEIGFLETIKDKTDEDLLKLLKETRKHLKENGNGVNLQSSAAKHTG